jgi:CBS-domain-containing membrane protein
VVTVGPETQLRDVAATLVEHRINAVPVVDAGDRLIGIVSEADLLTPEVSAVTRQQPNSPVGQRLPRTARQVMSQSVYTLTGDTDAAAAARLLLRHNLKSVPVVAGDRVVGMVARRDLLRLIARSDHDIQADLDRRLNEALDALRGVALDVVAGVVTIDGAVGPLGRQLLEGLARTVPGVVEVRTTQRGADGAESPRGTNGDR